MEPKERIAAQATSFPDLPEVGAAIKSRFDFVRKLEQDTGISTYLIQQKDDGNNCLVKLLTVDPLKESSKIESFRQIGQQLLALRHKNIVWVREQDVPLFGAAYLLTENVDGQNLSATLRQCQSVPPGETLELFMQLSSALEVAHAQKILHGNIHPRKIVVTDDGTTKISDFGLSFLQPPPDQNPGDPTYRSPEQCQGDAASEQSDIYSLGCVMYHALAGSPPFTQSGAIKLILQHVTESPNPVPYAKGDALTAGLSAIINKCLQKQPQDRYASAAALHADLLAVQQGKPPAVARIVNSITDRAKADPAGAQRGAGASDARNSPPLPASDGQPHRIGTPHLVALAIGIVIGALIAVLLMSVLSQH